MKDTSVNTDQLSLRLPQSKPCEDPSGLWTVQGALLSAAQAHLGTRDESKKIFQPQFTDEGPMLRNTPALDGAYVELSRAGENYWPTVMFELAHETVHLLDPIPGDTNYLEEGIAVFFSLEVASWYNDYVRSSTGPYRDALELTESLPAGPLEAGKRVRESVGALSNATAASMAALFPNVDERTLTRLTTIFDAHDVR